MRMNNKGMTVIEIIASIVLISIVLTFSVNLFINIRNTYNDSKIGIEYEMLKSNIINAVGTDIAELGLLRVSYTTFDNKNSIELVFNKKRKTDDTSNIVKNLTVDKNNNLIKYEYKNDIKLTDEEKLTGIIREFPKNAVIGNDIVLTENTNLNMYKIVIPLSSSKGVNYDINIVGKYIGIPQ